MDENEIIITIPTRYKKPFRFKLNIESNTKNPIKIYGRTITKNGNILPDTMSIPGLF
jgi:hypothetical protein|tara:strand:- start:1411 stop:1581 length:171 start_codon:yes stop_codon:yes gene_type:complete